MQELKIQEKHTWLRFQPVQANQSQKLKELHQIIGNNMKK